jgi:hypothetical protein
MSKSKNKPTKSKEINWSLWISILSLIAVIILGIVTYNQNERINALGKGNLNNDILISSPQHDTIRDKDMINLSLRLKSNYEGSIPADVNLNSIKLDGEEITEYSLTRIEEKELIVDGNDDGFFYYQFEPTKKGKYLIEYLFKYDYTQGGNEEDSKTKLWQLNIEVK